MASTPYSTKFFKCLLRFWTFWSVYCKGIEAFLNIILKPRKYNACENYTSSFQIITLKVNVESKMCLHQTNFVIDTQSSSKQEEITQDF